MSKEHVKDYITLSDCYDEMNAEFFDGKLPGCVLTFEDKGQCFGYYSHGSFVDRENKGVRDEIALNPRHFLTNSGDLEVLQTLAHEMCHQWQQYFGKPSARTYHNKEWAHKMLSIGLIPSHTGRPGGRMTGQTMADYTAQDGAFIRVASRILKRGGLISYYKKQVLLQKLYTDSKYLEENRDLGEVVTRPFQPDSVLDSEDETEFDPRVLAAAVIASAEVKKPVTSKVKHTCAGCGANAWGKPSLSLICGECHENEGVIIYFKAHQ